VVFTILSQWSVGIVLCIAALGLPRGETLATAPAGLSAGNPLFLSLLLVLVATTVSFLHLGTPSNAPKALKNLAGSWLSREILAIGVFTLCLAAAFVSRWVGGANGPSELSLLPAAIAGLFLLWTMSRVYLIPTLPAWNSWYTPFSFGGTALCLGVMTSLSITGPDNPESRLALGVLLTVLVLELASCLLHHRRLITLDSGFDGPVFYRGSYFRMFLTRTALLFLACLALIFILQAPTVPGTGLASWLYPFWILLVAQEVVGRVMFYSSYFRIGI
jgi:anaerobic dimethyl sulfoxide reductase subunit C (anchor subunit)